jgi:hypothetical protein
MGKRRANKRAQRYRKDLVERAAQTIDFAQSVQDKGCTSASLLAELKAGEDWPEIRATDFLEMDCEEALEGLESIDWALEENVYQHCELGIGQSGFAKLLEYFQKNFPAAE